MQNPITKKTLFFALLFSCIILVIVFCNQYFSKQTILVFCDVGQGDGTYMRIQNKIDIVIDAGPANNKMLHCLGTYMPFYDRTIEYAFISHSQTDHYGGFIEIYKRYKIDALFALPLTGSSNNIEILKQLINNHQTHHIIPTTGDTVSLLNTRLTFLSSSKALPSIIYAKDLNAFSVIVEIRTSDKRILFTGDATISTLYNLSLSPYSGKTILKVPHHGSQNSISESFLKQIHPDVAIISVGKNNSYGHPSKRVLDFLKKMGTQTRRTDKEGDIVIKL